MAIVKVKTTYEISVRSLCLFHAPRTQVLCLFALIQFSAAQFLGGLGYGSYGGLGYGGLGYKSAEFQYII